MTDVKIKCDSCKFVDGCVDYGWGECKKFTPTPSEPMTKLCNSCEYLKFCARSGIEEIGCGRYKRDTTTNEEWFCGLSTEEKAIWIERIMFIVRYRKEVEDGAYMQTITKKDYIENWLKEKHNEV